jgi:hypothetical protein
MKIIYFYIFQECSLKNVHSRTFYREMVMGIDALWNNSGRTTNSVLMISMLYKSQRSIAIE